MPRSRPPYSPEYPARRALPQRVCDPTHEDRLVERPAPPPFGITTGDPATPTISSGLLCHEVPRSAA